jgi:uncharacterized membrane protein YcaP (DUF421 family)
MISYDIIISLGEIIQSAAYSNSDDFQHVNFIFSLKMYFTIFGDYLMTKLTLEQCKSLWKIVLKLILKGVSQKKEKKKLRPIYQNSRKSKLVKTQDNIQTS